jgi:HD-GYP domain-containing protein (c-di-GMP phosphodiesterase class II)
MAVPASKKPGRPVHHVLAARMALAAAAASVIIAALAVVAERKSIGEVAVERALAGVVALKALIADEGGSLDRLDGARVQAALDRLRANATAQESGRFVSAVVSDGEGRRIAGIEDAAAMAAIGAATAPASSASPAYVYSRSNGVPIVSLAVPILRRDGTRAGSLSAVFEVSESAIEEATARIVRRVLIAIGIVLATSVIIYPIIARLVYRLHRSAHKLLDSNLDSIAALGSAIAKKDSDTDIHNYRVTIYAARLGEAAGLDRKAMCALMKGAFLHDIGKIGIPDAILLKPGPLNEEEFVQMKRHVEYGLEIVQQSSWLADAADVVGGHHEKFDGSGYLHGLRGEAIPLNARIFAIADVFDALTSRRPYKEPMSYAEAMRIIESGSGAHFDPRLFEIFAGIARPLYDEFGNRDDERPRTVLRELIDYYFKSDDEILFA